jgi:hypothetical protein
MSYKQRTDIGTLVFPSPYYPRGIRRLKILGGTLILLPCVVAPFTPGFSGANGVPVLIGLVAGGLILWSAFGDTGHIGRREVYSEGIRVCGYLEEQDKVFLFKDIAGMNSTYQKKYGSKVLSIHLIPRDGETIELDFSSKSDGVAFRNAVNVAAKATNPNMMISWEDDFVWLKLN